MDVIPISEVHTPVLVEKRSNLKYLNVYYIFENIIKVFQSRKLLHLDHLDKHTTLEEYNTLMVNFLSDL